MFNTRLNKQSTFIFTVFFVFCLFLSRKNEFALRGRIVEYCNWNEPDRVYRDQRNKSLLYLDRDQLLKFDVEKNLLLNTFVPRKSLGEEGKKIDIMKNIHTTTASLMIIQWIYETTRETFNTPTTETTLKHKKKEDFFLFLLFPLLLLLLLLLVLFYRFTSTKTDQRRTFIYVCDNCSRSLSLSLFLHTHVHFISSHPLLDYS